MLLCAASFDLEKRHGVYKNFSNLFYSNFFPRMESGTDRIILITNIEDFHFPTF